MDPKINSFLIILMVLMMSCKNQNNENVLPHSDQNEINENEKQEPKAEEAKIDKINITEQLQGKWKEIEYPYRTVDFVSSTVKFVEEGTESTPKFEKFEVSADCPFNNNNIRNLSSSDIILTLPENRRCEKLKASGDTLTLSGYSTNTNEDYNIMYLKLK